MPDLFSSLIGVPRRLKIDNSSAFLTLAVLVFSGLCLKLGMSASGVVQVFTLTISGAAALLGLASAANLLFLKPGRLDTKELSQMNAYLSWLSRPEQDERAMQSAEIVVPAILQQKSLKNPAATWSMTLMRTERNYIIVFDPLDARFDPLSIRKVIKSDERTSHWWNHMVNCFLVTSLRSPGSMTRLILKHSPEVGFFVMEVDPTKSEGYLPERSWEWIRERESEASAASA